MPPDQVIQWQRSPFTKLRSWVRIPLNTKRWGFESPVRTKVSWCARLVSRGASVICVKGSNKNTSRLVRGSATLPIIIGSGIPTLHVVALLVRPPAVVSSPGLHVVVLPLIADHIYRFGCLIGGHLPLLQPHNCRSRTTSHLALLTLMFSSY